MTRGGGASRGFPSTSTRDPQTDRAYLRTLHISCLHLLAAAAADDTGFQRIVIEGFLKLLAGPVEPRHDGPDRHAQGLRRVLVGKPFDVDQEDDLAMQRGQLFD